MATTSAGAGERSTWKKPEGGDFKRPRDAGDRPFGSKVAKDRPAFDVKSEHKKPKPKKVNKDKGKRRKPSGADRG